MVALTVSRRRAGPLAAVSVWALVLFFLAGCTSGDANPTPTPSPTNTPAPAEADGIPLGQAGVRHGPPRFSLPRGSVAATTVDQSNNVVLVLSAPAPAEVAGYLRTALPATGFSVVAVAADRLTFTFRGDGWSGSFTRSAASSVILLRPL